MHPHLGSSCCGQPCDLFRPRPGFEPSMCTPVTPAVPYLLLGLQGVQWAVGNSCGARKLARTPHVNQKKYIYILIVNLNIRLVNPSITSK